MLRIQAAVEAGRAEQCVAQVRVFQSRFELTRAAGRPEDSPWLVPVTVPHSGPYQLKADLQPQAAGRSWRVRELTVLIPQQLTVLQDYAGVVVQSNAARAAAAAGYQSGSGSADRALDAVRRQHAAMLGFLQSLTDYNQSFADYLLAVAPPSVTADQLVKSLVIVR